MAALANFFPFFFVIQDGNGRSRNGHNTKEKREAKISTGGQGSSVNVGRASSTSVEAYRRQNEIIVTVCLPWHPSVNYYSS